jgi:hypothetical protein
MLGVAGLAMNAKPPVTTMAGPYAPPWSTHEYTEHILVPTTSLLLPLSCPDLHRVYPRYQHTTGTEPGGTQVDNYLRLPPEETARYNIYIFSIILSPRLGELHLLARNAIPGIPHLNLGQTSRLHTARLEPIIPISRPLPTLAISIWGRLTAKL